MRRALLALGVVAPLIAFTFVWASCSDASAPGAPAAADASGPERSSPKPLDADIADGPADASSSDAGPFPDEDPFAGTWNQVPSTPASCKYLYAANPASLRSKWLPCASGRAGCRALDTSWTKRDGRRIFSSRITDSQRIAGGKAVLLTRRLWPGPFPNPYYAYIDVVEPLDEDPVLAIGAAPTWVNGLGRTCHIQAIFGDYGVGFMAHPWDVLNPSAPTDEDIWGWAPWATPSAFTTHTTKSVDWDAGSAILFPEGTMGVDRIFARAHAPVTTALFR
jgi:hypothetical protein